PDAGHPRGFALVAAAVDLARSGLTAPQPRERIEKASEHYLPDPPPPPEDADAAWQWATRVRSGGAGLLVPAGHERWRAFDYLTSDEPVPEATWRAALAWAGGQDRFTIGVTAHPADRYDVAEQASRRAAETGDSDAMTSLGVLLADAGAKRASAEGPKTHAPTGVGRPITDWNPHDLEVHPATELDTPREMTGVATSREQSALPGYVRRPHDDELAARIRAAAEGRSGMAVLVGSSSTGKTRACWEAVQPLSALGWRLWHPLDPSRVTAALEELERVGPRTVVWLNEAQHYLGASGGVGDRLATALHLLLTQPERGPVLVLGTLWDDYARRYTAVPEPGGADPHAQARELLAGRLISVPDDFSEAAISEARGLADEGDRRLAHALEHLRGRRLAQFLAGAPELVRRYRSASPGARALIEAAMDARRIGVGPNLSLAFLADAAEDYLDADESDSLEDDWLERAVAETGESVHGRLAPLRRARRVRRFAGGVDTGSIEPGYRLADYLEQLGRHERDEWCPPPSFWQAATDHISDPEELYRLAETADDGYHLHHWGDRLLRRSVEAGDTRSMAVLALGEEQAGRRQSAEELAQRAADAGDPHGLMLLADMRVGTGDRPGAEDLARRFARIGAAHLLRREAEIWEKVGLYAWAVSLYRQVADTESPASNEPDTG
ncbi:hypothetical protein ACFQZ2_04100, partial [Streptomonospora algeriensis]